MVRCCCQITKPMIPVATSAAPATIATTFTQRFLVFALVPCCTCWSALAMTTILLLMIAACLLARLGHLLRRQLGQVRGLGIGVLLELIEMLAISTVSSMRFCWTMSLMLCCSVFITCASETASVLLETGRPGASNSTRITGPPTPISDFVAEVQLALAHLAAPDQRAVGAADVDDEPAAVLDHQLGVVAQPLRGQQGIQADRRSGLRPTRISSVRADCSDFPASEPATC